MIYITSVRSNGSSASKVNYLQAREFKKKKVKNNLKWVIENR